MVEITVGIDGRALTLLLTLICMAGVFLMLFAEVAFIQDNPHLIMPVRAGG